MTWRLHQISNISFPFVSKKYVIYTWFIIRVLALIKLIKKKELEIEIPLNKLPVNTKQKYTLPIAGALFYYLSTKVQRPFHFPIMKNHLPVSK